MNTRQAGIVMIAAALIGASLNPARAQELSPKRLYQKTAPAVVLLMCFGADGNGELGTGTVINDRGQILTNAHVVTRGSTQKPFEKIRVYFKPAKVTGDPKLDLIKPYEGRVVVFDRPLDLAIVEIDEKPGDLSVLPLGDALAVEPGDPVVAIGHPEQGGLWTLTQGVVSTVVSGLGGVQGKDVFQTDASINRGNSGGPLISRQGGLIGVNTSMARKAADGLTITSVNFSVKSSVVRHWLASSNIKPWVLDSRAPAAEPVTPQTREPLPTPQAEPAEIPAPAPAAKTPPKGGQDRSPAGSTAASPEKTIVTPKKPFKIADLLEREMAEMDDLEAEMSQEVEKRRGEIEAMPLKDKKRRDN